MNDKMILGLILGYGLGAATFPFAVSLARGLMKRVGRLFSRRRSSRGYHY